MKVSVSSFSTSCTATVFNTVQEAIDDALTPSAYSWNTRKEKLAIENEKVREMLSRLVNLMVEKDLICAAELKEILGHGYEVNE